MKPSKSRAARLLSAPSVLVLFLALCLPAPLLGAPPASPRLHRAMQRVLPGLRAELARKGLGPGAPAYIRIFKLGGELELWLASRGRYRLFKRYNICASSGFPGPKLHEGDWQSPEGFYSVTPARMNPNSRYHLALDLGFPNEYDQRHGRTGSALMIHGGCSSMGCYAMTDRGIEEIYTLVHLALAQGQDRVEVHIFPFPLTRENMRHWSSSPWIAFWRELQPAYLAFEKTRVVPLVRVSGGRYVVENNRIARMSGP